MTDVAYLYIAGVSGFGPYKVGRSMASLIEKVLTDYLKQGGYLK